MVWASDSDASLWRYYILLMSNLEETLRQAQKCWKDNISQLAWEHFLTPQEEMEEVAREKSDKQQKMDRWNV